MLIQLSRAELDAIDLQILRERQAKRDRQPGARVGDFLKMPDGTLRRFSSKWNEPWKENCFLGVLLNENGRQVHGNFYLNDKGNVEFSGEVNYVKGLAIEQTSKKMDGEFWFFHHDRPGAGGGVEVAIPCRVFAPNWPEKRGDIAIRMGRILRKKLAHRRRA